MVDSSTDVGGDAVLEAAPDGVHDLRPTGVVEGDVERHPGAPGGLLRVPPRWTSRVGSAQLRHPTQQPDRDALAHQVGGVVTDGGVEQREQHLDLLARARPVLAAEGVDGEHLDATLLGPLDDGPDRVHARGVTLGLGDAALARPSAIAVHDDRDMPRRPVDILARTAGGSSPRGCGPAATMLGTEAIRPP